MYADHHTGRVSVRGILALLCRRRRSFLNEIPDLYRVSKTANNSIASIDKNSMGYHMPDCTSMAAAELEHSEKRPLSLNHKPVHM